MRNGGQRQKLKYNYQKLRQVSIFALLSLTHVCLSTNIIQESSRNNFWVTVTKIRVWALLCTPGNTCFQDQAQVILFDFDLENSGFKWVFIFYGVEDQNTSQERRNM